MSTHPVVCPVCHGEGREITHFECTHCAGTGVVDRDEYYSVGDRVVLIGTLLVAAIVTVLVACGVIT